MRDSNVVNNRLTCPKCSKDFCWICLERLSNEKSCFDHFSPGNITGCIGMQFSDIRTRSVRSLSNWIVAEFIILPLYFLYHSTQNTNNKLYESMDGCLQSQNRIVKFILISLTFIILFPLIFAFEVVKSVLLYPFGIVSQFRRILRVCLRNKRYNHINSRVLKLDKMGCLQLDSNVTSSEALSD